MRRILVFLLILGLLPAARAAAGGEKTVTVMIYMCGSNLESESGAATLDLIEMAGSGYDAKKVNLLVMTGGTRAWRMGLPTDALCIYVPFRNSLRMVYAFESMSMGSPEALGALLAFGAEKYPADEYALILWNHGGGPMNGICWDELYDPDHLTMEELCEALRRSPFAEKKLSWIGFDACLMASAENAFLMEPFADYMIASEETEPAGGWNYSFLKGLEEDPDPSVTARRIIDAYFSAGEPGEDMTLSCVDLSRMKPLGEAMDAFFGDLEVSGGNYAWFSYAARNTRGFGKALTPGESYDLVDLGGLVSHLEDQEPSGAARVREALSGAVVYSRSSGGEGSGLSVYHPFFNKREYAASWGAFYPRIGFSGGYSRYIARFSEYLFGTAADPEWGGLRTACTDREGVYALPLTQAQRGMLSSSVMVVLRRDAAENAYTPIALETRSQEADGVIFAEDPRQVLVAEDESGRRLTGALPYGILPGGQLAVYVNFCTEEAAARDEALTLPDSPFLPGSKAYGSTSYGEDEVQTESLQQDLPQPTARPAENPAQDTETETGTFQLWQEVHPVPAPNLSPLSGTDTAETVIVPKSLPLHASAVPPGASAGVYVPAGSAPVAIEPAEMYSESLPAADDMIPRMAGSGIPLDSFTTVEVSSFGADKVEVDLTRYDPEQFPKREPEAVLHSQWVLEAGENGELRVAEIRLYEPLNGEWSARMTAPLEEYPVLVVPVVWRQPALIGDALAPLDRWTEVRREGVRIPNAGVRLRFVPDSREDACVLFEVTDIQSAACCSVPVEAAAD